MTSGELWDAWVHLMASGGIWLPLGDSGDNGASGCIWWPLVASGALGASGGLWVHLGHDGNDADADDDGDDDGEC